MGDKILVAYATRVGSTAEVAKAIGEELAAEGAAVDVLPVKSVKDLSPYRAVVVGSAIRAGKWQPEAVKFVQSHRAELSSRSVAYFQVCLTMAEDNEETRSTTAGYLEPVRAIVQPVDEGSFGGVMDPTKLSLFFRGLMRVMKAPSGDFRDWAAIRAWAASLRPRLATD